jgi:hypothetical protein
VPQQSIERKTFILSAAVRTLPTWRFLVKVERCILPAKPRLLGLDSAALVVQTQP